MLLSQWTMQCETEFLNNKVFLAIANIVGPTASSGNDSKAPDSASCLSCLVDPALHISSDHAENAYFKWNPFSSFVAPHKILFNVTQNCDAVRTEEVRRNKKHLFAFNCGFLRTQVRCNVLYTTKSFEKQTSNATLIIFCSQLRFHIEECFVW